MQHNYQETVKENINTTDTASSVYAFYSCIEYLLEEAKELKLKNIENALELTKYIVKKEHEDLISKFM